MSIVFVGVSPHPPLIIPEIGKEDLERVGKTVKSMQVWAQHFRETEPDAVVFFTPHGAVFRDAIAVTTDREVRGDFGRFGARRVAFARQIDQALVTEILTKSRRRGLPAFALTRELGRDYRVSTDLDHGILVPLYYLDRAGIDTPIVPITMGMLSYEELYAFGQAIQEAAAALDRRVAVVASADLSHRLTRTAPAGYAPEGAEFDAAVCRALSRADAAALLEIPGELVEKAGECGLRPIYMGLGTLDGYAVRTTIHSYEGPFGVGYLVAEFIPEGQDTSRNYAEQMAAKRKARIKARREQESEPVRLARAALESYVCGHGRIEVPSQLSPEMKRAAGVFVSLKKNNQLRGCIGTIKPTCPNVAGEIIRNAISAGTEDPRFAPVTEAELDELVYSVDILGEPEAVSDPGQLDPKRYGVIVRRGRRTGLLLPNLEGIETVAEQLAIARRKAGIGENEPVELERFEVVRYT